MTLFAAVLETEGFTVGQDNSRSGLFRREKDGSWTSLGWRNIRNFGIAISPDYIFLASGNGVLRSADDGENWRVTTDWKIAEVLDIVIDSADPHKLVIATAHGIAWSPDDGDTWHANSKGLTSTFVQSIVHDPSTNRWLAGTEDGLFSATDPEGIWTRIGLAGLAVRRIAIGEDVCAVATDGAGLWLRSDKAGRPVASPYGIHKDWKKATGLPPDASFYTTAVSDDGKSVSAGGYQTGVYLSQDAGASWSHLADGLTNLTIQALSFHPDTGELWAGTSGGGAFRLDDRRWISEGLPGSTIRKFYFDNNR